MSRARVNPHKRPATLADVKRAKAEAVEDATTLAWRAVGHAK